MKHVVVAAAAAAVLAVLPSAVGASTSSFRGIVVGRQAGSVLVASPAGLVQAFSGHAAVGSRIAFAGGRLVVVGHARTARLHAVVVRRLGSMLFLASNHHMVAVRAARGLASASDTPPATPTTQAPGTVVNAQVQIEDQQLVENEVEDVGKQSAAAVSAVVSAVGAGTVTLTVNGQTLTVPLPAGLTLPASIVGQTVTIQLSFSGQDDQGEQEDQQGQQADDESTESTSTSATSVTASGDSHGGDNGGDGGGDH